MGIIYTGERGRLVEASDAYGTYYYLGDGFGNPGSDGWTDRTVAERAWETLSDPTLDEAEANGADLYPASDVDLDASGRRVLPCAYCNVDVSIVPVPDVDDEAGWAEAAGQHADDCDWVLTRAHRLDLDRIRAEVIAQAQGDAGLFVDEFHEPLDPAATDWDSTAWGMVNIVGASGMWDDYQAALVAETERLCDEEAKS